MNKYLVNKVLFKTLGANCSLTKYTYRDTSRSGVFASDRLVARPSLHSGRPSLREVST